VKVMVSGDFWIAIEYLKDNIQIGYDSSSSAGRSAFGIPGNWYPITENIMIRAVVDPYYPVGGVVLSVNKLHVFAPYVILVGLATTASIVLIVKKRR